MLLILHLSQNHLNCTVSDELTCSYAISETILTSALYHLHSITTTLFPVEHSTATVGPLQIINSGHSQHHNSYGKLSLVLSQQSIDANENLTLYFSCTLLLQYLLSLCPYQSWLDWCSGWDPG